MKKTEALKRAAAKQGFSGNFLIFNPFNLAYFTGFSGATALLVPERGENVLFVGGVNYEQAKTEAKAPAKEEKGKPDVKEEKSKPDMKETSKGKPETAKEEAKK